MKKLAMYGERNENHNFLAYVLDQIRMQQSKSKSIPEFKALTLFYYTNQQREKKKQYRILKEQKKGGDMDCCTSRKAKEGKHEHGAWRRAENQQATENKGEKV